MARGCSRLLAALVYSIIYEIYQIPALSLSFLLLVSLYKSINPSFVALLLRIFGSGKLRFKVLDQVKTTLFLRAKHINSHLNCRTRRHDEHTRIQADAQG